MKHDQDRNGQTPGGVDWTPRRGYRPVDGIVVGIGHEYEAEETFGAAQDILGSVG